MHTTALTRPFWPYVIFIIAALFLVIDHAM